MKDKLKKRDRSKASRAKRQYKEFKKKIVEEYQRKLEALDRLFFNS